MNDQTRIKYLKIALIIFGVIFTFLILPLTQLWPSGWAWHTEGRSYYLEMILVVYATLGIFLMIAAKNPIEHKSLIWFTVWSSVAHGGVMAWQSFDGEHNMGHLMGDVPALFIVAVVLAYLMPKSTKQ